MDEFPVGSQRPDLATIDSICYIEGCIVRWSNLVSSVSTSIAHNLGYDKVSTRLGLQFTIAGWSSPVSSVGS